MEPVRTERRRPRNRERAEQEVKGTHADRYRSVLRLDRRVVSFGVQRRAGAGGLSPRAESRQPGGDLVHIRRSGATAPRDGAFPVAGRLR